MGLLELMSFDVEQAVERFEQFHNCHAAHFSTQTRDVSMQATHYVHDQLVRQHYGKLMEFEKSVPESKSQSLPHFVANSPCFSLQLI